VRRHLGLPSAAEMIFIPAYAVRATERGSDFVASGPEMSSLELAGNQGSSHAIAAPTSSNP